MTAAPGPQQPDELWCSARNGRDSCMYMAGHDGDHRTVGDGISFPAAPSAQPDEFREGTASALAAAGFPALAAELRAPAQPVRDTGEGRR